MEISAEMLDDLRERKHECHYDSPTTVDSLHLRKR
jgi:hypothetical protein